MMAYYSRLVNRTAILETRVGPGRLITTHKFNFVPWNLSAGVLEENQAAPPEC